MYEYYFISINISRLSPAIVTITYHWTILEKIPRRNKQTNIQKSKKQANKPKQSNKQTNKKPKQTNKQTNKKQTNKQTKNQTNKQKTQTNKQTKINIPVNSISPSMNTKYIAPTTKYQTAASYPSILLRTFIKRHLKNWQNAWVKF